VGVTEMLGCDPTTAWNFYDVEAMRIFFFKSFGGPFGNSAQSHAVITLLLRHAGCM
jgi:hypothetical protein